MSEPVEARLARVEVSLDYIRKHLESISTNTSVLPVLQSEMKSTSDRVDKIESEMQELITEIRADQSDLREDIRELEIQQANVQGLSSILKWAAGLLASTGAGAAVLKWLASGGPDAAAAAQDLVK